MSKFIHCACLSAVFILFAATVQAQPGGGIDPEALIDRILEVERTLRAELETVVMDAEYFEGEFKNGSFEEKERFEMKIYLKVLEDTTWYQDEYLAYYKDGEQQDEKDLRNAEKDRREKKKKRKAFDISYRMIKPFLPEYRDRYEISYQGVSAEVIDGHICHEFTVTAKEEDEELINGRFYFEADEFHLVRVDFTPAKLVKKMMFRMKQLDMSVLYTPVEEGFWLPKQFEIRGKGKAALLIGVSFAGLVHYTNHQVNQSLDDDFFTGVNNDQ